MPYKRSHKMRPNTAKRTNASSKVSVLIFEKVLDLCSRCMNILHFCFSSQTSRKTNSRDPPNILQIHSILSNFALDLHAKCRCAGKTKRCYRKYRHFKLGRGSSVAATVSRSYPFENRPCEAPREQAKIVAWFLGIGREDQARMFTNEPLVRV